jgi:predicted transcriptional regulator
MARNTSRKSVSVLLEPELVEKLDALAEKRSRSRTAQLRWMLLRELKRSGEVRRTPESERREDSTTAA